MSPGQTADWLVDLRRDLHRRPEPAWCEFYTTSRIVEELERIGVDELFVGPDALAGEHRRAVPPDDELDRWFERARDAGVREELLDRLSGGYTGAVAVIERGEGPTVALRVDVDGLPRPESDDPSHVPAAEGFRSVHENTMHACGHDAHAAIGLGVVDAIRSSDFTGTLKVIFQPAEEVIGGGEAVARSGHLDDVDYLLAVHVGLDHPTGTVVAGIEGFLAVRHLDVAFTGEAAHAGGRPERGRNAIQALATAIQNLYAIPRHGDGATRVNVGVVEGGTAANIVAEAASMVVEVRGETTPLMEYMDAKARTAIEHAAAMHSCEYEIVEGPSAPSAESDAALVDLIAANAPSVDGVETVLERHDLGGSEDATFLMREVQEGGGRAAYVGVGTDHPGGHHTATFDVDEASIAIGVDMLVRAIEVIGQHRP